MAFPFAEYSPLGKSIELIRTTARYYPPPPSAKVLLRYGVVSGVATPNRLKCVFSLYLLGVHEVWRMAVRGRERCENAILSSVRLPFRHADTHR